MTRTASKICMSCVAATLLASIPAQAQQSGSYTGQDDQTGQSWQDRQTGQRGQAGQSWQDRQTGQRGQTGQSWQDRQTGQRGQAGQSWQDRQTGQRGQTGQSWQDRQTGQRGQTGQSWQQRYSGQVDQDQQQWQGRRTGQRGQSGQSGSLYYEDQQTQYGDSDESFEMRSGQSQVLFRASQLVGTDATSADGQKLGRLQEIVFHPDIGIYGVISLSNGRVVPVPWQLIEAVTVDGLVFDTTMQVLNSAPTITGGQWSSFNNARFTREIAQHFRVGPEERMGRIQVGERTVGSEYEAVGGQRSSGFGAGAAQGTQTWRGQEDRQEQYRQQSQFGREDRYGEQGQFNQGQDQQRQQGQFGQRRSGGQYNQQRFDQRQTDRDWREQDTDLGRDRQSQRYND